MWSFMGRFQRRSFGSDFQVERSIEGKDAKVIAMGAGRRAGTAVAGFAEVVCPLRRPVRLTPFADLAGGRSDVPKSTND
jgi:hypothetical protein